jgi:hypothetical protein
LDGRIIATHYHYQLSLPTAEKPGDAPKGPDASPFARNCTVEGGGDYPEKIRRFNRLLQFACELQGQVGKITDAEALKRMTEEVWKAGGDGDVLKIIEEKKFDFTCVFPDDVAPAPVSKLKHLTFRDLKMKKSCFLNKWIPRLATRWNHLTNVP